MPSKSKKKAQEQASKKALQKKKERMIDDKTFGLKNKNKSASKYLVGSDMFMFVCISCAYNY